MWAIDTNVLVHAHRADSPFHRAASTTVRALAEGDAAWAIPWPCLHEFYATVTHPKVFQPPSTAEEGLRQIEAWMGSPSLVLLGEGPDHAARLAALVRAGKVTGPRVHDARIAAICLAHRVTVLLTADRDFGRFPSLVTRNPLV